MYYFIILSIIYNTDTWFDMTQRTDASLCSTYAVLYSAGLPRRCGGRPKLIRYGCIRSPHRGTAPPNIERCDGRNGWFWQSCATTERVERYRRLFAEGSAYADGTAALYDIAETIHSLRLRHTAIRSIVSTTTISYQHKWQHTNVWRSQFCLERNRN